jgi:hypothetical protein
MFEPKREKVTESWKQFQKAELHGLSFVLLKLNHIKEIEVDEERDTHGGNEISAQDFDGENCTKGTIWNTWASMG